MAIDDLTSYLDAAVAAAERGAAVLEEWRGRFQVREKGRADLVTDADVSSQRAIQAYLRERFPGHGFLGEEGDGHKGCPPAGSPPTWIVDPLDGTTNYAHDVPLYCVSIGLWMNGAMVVGAVFDPRHKEMFAAVKGRGATLNSQPLRTTTTTRLADALLATGFPPDLRGQERTLGWWRHFSLKTQSLRRTGSTALNLAWLAAGRYDGYWAFDNHVWDVAGGMVILTEAGGLLTNVDGTPYDPFSPDALASNGPLHPALLTEMKGEPA
jgi:myo-inositol-1(or 4)-monophosphatase